MSDQGLSIFDEPDGEGADEQPTKVMKAQGQDAAATASKPKKKPAAPEATSDETTVSVHPSRAGAESLQRALHTALAEGYGDCFWPGMPGGQYWWIFKCEQETLETIAGEQ